MNKNRKGNVHLFLIVVIAIIGAVGLLYYSWQRGLIKTSIQEGTSPTPTSGLDETASWKTYTYENITFKYPPDWEERETVSVPEEMGYAGFGVEIKKDDEYLFLLMSGIDIGKSPEEIDEFFDDHISVGGEKRKIGNYPGVVYSTTLAGEEGTITYAAYIAPSAGPTSITMQLIAAEDNDQAEKVFNQILSTFKFLD